MILIKKISWIIHHLKKLSYLPKNNKKYPPSDISNESIIAKIFALVGTEIFASRESESFPLQSKMILSIYPPTHYPELCQSFEFFLTDTDFSYIESGVIRMKKICDSMEENEKSQY